MPQHKHDHLKLQVTHVDHKKGIVHFAVEEPLKYSGVPAQHGFPYSEGQVFVVPLPMLSEIQPLDHDRAAFGSGNRKTCYISGSGKTP